VRVSSSSSSSKSRWLECSYQLLLHGSRQQLRRVWMVMLGWRQMAAAVLLLVVVPNLPRGRTAVPR
jgi:hypothetical protein